MQSNDTEDTAPRSSLNAASMSKSGVNAGRHAEVGGPCRCRSGSALACPNYNDKTLSHH